MCQAALVKTAFTRAPVALDGRDSGQSGVLRRRLSSVRAVFARAASHKGTSSTCWRDRASGQRGEGASSGFAVCTPRASSASVRLSAAAEAFSTACGQGTLQPLISPNKQKKPPAYEGGFMAGLCPGLGVLLAAHGSQPCPGCGWLRMAPGFGFQPGLRPSVRARVCRGS